MPCLPNAQSPMPNPQCPRTPHVTEKGYTMQSLGSELKRDETTLVLVSGKRAITKEWRFFIYKNQIITGSLYLVGEERIDETIRGGYLENYLSEVFCPSELVSRICLHDRYLRV